MPVRLPSLPRPPSARAVGLLTYANLVVARGMDAFYVSAARAGIDSVLVADVPLIEAAPFAAAARAHKVAPVLIAAANTPPARLARIAALGGGYTYCVARSGVTGADEEVRLDHAPLLATLRAAGGRRRCSASAFRGPPMSAPRSPPAPPESSPARPSSSGAAIRPRSPPSSAR
jgi:hypothetical protein